MIRTLLLEEVQPGIHIKHGTDAQPNPLHICQTPQAAYHYSPGFIRVNL